MLEEKYNNLPGGSSYKRRILEYQEHIHDINSSRKNMTSQISAMRACLLRYGGAYGAEIVSKPAFLNCMHDIDISEEEEEGNSSGVNRKNSNGNGNGNAKHSMHDIHSTYQEISIKAQNINDMLVSLLKE